MYQYKISIRVLKDANLKIGSIEGAEFSTALGASDYINISMQGRQPINNNNMRWTQTIIDIIRQWHPNQYKNTEDS